MIVYLIVVAMATPDRGSCLLLTLRLVFKVIALRSQSSHSIWVTWQPHLLHWWQWWTPVEVEGWLTCLFHTICVSLQHIPACTWPKGNSDSYARKYTSNRILSSTKQFERFSKCRHEQIKTVRKFDWEDRSGK